MMRRMVSLAVGMTPAEVAIKHRAIQPRVAYEGLAFDLSSDTVRLFASRDTPDLATGQPVGGAFTNPDHLAIDANGNIYIVEDRPGGVEDIWFASDTNNDGVAEAIGKGPACRPPSNSDRRGRSFPRHRLPCDSARER